MIAQKKRTTRRISIKEGPVAILNNTQDKLDTQKYLIYRAKNQRRLKVALNRNPQTIIGRLASL